MKRSLALVLAALASLLLLAVRHLERGDAIAERPSAQTAATAAAEAGRPSNVLGDPDLDRQVAAVIESMDRTGRPPAGIAQGARKGGQRGLFQNAEGRLPREQPGFYTETDVWPGRAGGRGPQRLIFGRGGEVYYTADHYRTFVRVR